LQATQIKELNPELARQLREQHFNCVVVEVSDAASPTWDLADRFGFFVLGRIAQDNAWPIARRLEGRPSSLGWILNQGALAGLNPKDFEGTSYTGSAPLIGLEVEQIPELPVPGVNFLVAASGSVETPTVSGLPWLRIERGDKQEGLDLSSGILGTLR